MPKLSKRGKIALKNLHSGKRQETLTQKAREDFAAKENYPVRYSSLNIYRLMLRSDKNGKATKQKNREEERARNVLFSVLAPVENQPRSKRFCHTKNIKGPSEDKSSDISTPFMPSEAENLRKYRGQMSSSELEEGLGRGWCSMIRGL